MSCQAAHTPLISGLFCPELIDKEWQKPEKLEQLANSVNLYTSDKIHEDGVRLISDWFGRALKAYERNCPPDESFEPFIYAWIAFNAWASRITNLERDKEMSDREITSALGLNQTLGDVFDSLLQGDPTFQKDASTFRSLWPIFKAQSLPHDIRYGVVTIEGDRADIIKRYVAEGATIYSPRCWQRHMTEEGTVPLDWPHTLAAIYQIRCNVFHGEKHRHSENDRQLVYGAFRTLVGFVRSFPANWRLYKADIHERT